MNPIKHMAIIMDGNGRWGLKHKNSRNLGHREGLKTVEMVNVPEVGTPADIFVDELLPALARTNEPPR